MNPVLDSCNGLPVRDFAPGDRLIAEGETGSQMFVLVSGEVRVTKGQTEVARESDPGALYGEMSALLDMPYSASVTAASPVRAHVVESPAVFLRTHPAVALHAARLLAQRLHDATTYLADLKEQFKDNADHFGLMDKILDALMHQQRREVTTRESVLDDPRL